MISQVGFLLTNRCNSKCRYCYLNAESGDVSQFLAKEDICAFLDRYKTHGGRSIMFSGGEALLYPDLEEVLQYAKGLELEVTLFTNGLALDEERLLRIKDHVLSISTSLDGPEEIHDYNRGVKGAYARVIEAMELFKKHKIDFSIQMTIGKSNFEYIDYVGEIAQKYGAHNVSLVKIINQGRGSKCDDLLDESDLIKIKAKAVELSKKHKYRPYFMTHIYLEKEIQAYFKSDILMPIYWIDAMGDICLYSTDHKEKFKLCHINEYPEGVNQEVWPHMKQVVGSFCEKVRGKKVMSFDEELEMTVQSIR